ncbi:LapA family protein [Pseudomonas japonica]|uniref:Lipopolysaccharide assembly protein A domain-containing protein n=1 Tax=Pseudomonas japonica TaxID=256466 RepID=A0A239HDM4_9PSED|nr:LapA family protein [Pseudomonas japonica]SNS79460.1 Protein of unknown function [Pseudomonas japonica]
MFKLKRVLVTLFILLLVALVLFFVLENQQVVSLIIFGWSTPAIPLAVPVLLALIIGLAIGPLMGWYGVMRHKRDIRASARRAAQVQG